MTTLNLKSLVEKLNEESRNSLQNAASICVTRHHYNVELDHYLLAFIHNENSAFCLLLKHNQVNLEQLIFDLNTNLEQLKTGNDQTPAISTRIIELINEAWLIASLEHGEITIHSGFLLQALLQNTMLKQIANGLSDELKKLSLDTIKAQQEMIRMQSTEMRATETPTVHSSQKALSRYAINLNEQAKLGKIDAVIGRENEIRQMIDVLSRRRQNNAILTGEPGVGKTAIVEGLALNIVNNQVPENLKDVIIYALDIGLLQAGAGVKGEFEERLKNLIAEIKQSVVPIILFIDEAHTLIGAGNQAGGSDAANLLKPALARGELRSIAATTWAEYKQYFEKDAALTRRFQVIKVEEPNVETAIQMLRNVAPAMEKHHNVPILDSALHTATHLSLRYMMGRYLPDKAISVLDTACARVASKQAGTPALIEQQQTLQTQLDIEKAVLLKESQQGINHKARLAELERKSMELKESLIALNDRWQQEKDLVDQIKVCYKKMDLNTEDTASSQSEFIHLKKQLAKTQQEHPLVSPWVDDNTVVEVIADWTGIPVGNMLKDEAKQRLHLKTLLQNKIVGQDHALTQITQIMQASGAKLSDPNKPLGVFLFLGPSGVGKTETALCLAEILYGSEHKTTVINMSEFKEEHKVSMLVGAPPGYVGYGEGGVLTEAVRRKPYSLILLDEIEKAHPGVQDVFYQVFDRGIIKDGQGRDIDFKNTVIILTSNACSEIIDNYYITHKNTLDLDNLLVAIQPELTQLFKPAFLGRVTLVPYLPLREEVLEKIIQLKLDKVVQRMADNQKIKLIYNNQLVQQILDKCKTHEIGARQIDTIITRLLIPTLSEKVLEGIIHNKPLKNLVITTL